MKADPSAVHGLAVSALRAGAEHLSAGHVRWDIAGRCLNPYGVEQFASGTDILHRNRIVWVEMQVRCRRCVECLRYRSRLWRARGRAEIALWPRSWFGTLTVSPEYHMRAMVLASAELADQAVRWDTLSQAEQFAERVRVIGKEITLYIKRCRKALNVPVRYFLVAEPHKSGLPHFHILLHECEPFSGDAWDSYILLKSQWRIGHCSYNGITAGDVRAAGYVCKYLSKSSEARVRASVRYGRAAGE